MSTSRLPAVREALDIARYAAGTDISARSAPADAAWLNGLRALALGLVACVDVVLETAPVIAEDSEPWSDEEQRLFGRWLRRTHPALPSDAVMALGDAWRDGHRTGISQKARAADAQVTP